MNFTAKAVNGIDNIIIGVEIKKIGSRFTVDFLDSGNFSVRINLQKYFFKHICFDLSNSLRSRQQLTVNVGNANPVGIDDG